MTIILANSRITSTFCKPSTHRDQVSPDSPSSESSLHQGEEPALNFAVKRNSANPGYGDDSMSSAPDDFDLVIPSSSIVGGVNSQMPLEVAVMEMNDKEHQQSIVNNNKKLSCDQISEINNNHTFKMGVKYHTFNNLLNGEEDDPRSMSPKVLQDIMGVQQKNRNSCVNSNGSIDRKLDNNNTAEVSMVVDNNNSITTGGSGRCAEEDTEDDDDCGGDNESVLSVGRDEANFDDVNHSDDEEDGNEQEEKPTRMNSALEEHQNGSRTLQKPIAVPFESPTANEKLNLGLSFRNIHNHLTSLKNYSPFDVFSVAAAATVNPLWKNSAFQAAAASTPTPFQGLSSMNPHPTVELLHHYDMFRNANLTNRPAGSAPHQNGRRDFHDESLKFSIDNILKADFGRRRITDPINKLRKISNTIIQSHYPAKLPSTRHSSFDAMSPTSTTSNSSSSSPPVLRSPPPQESPRKLFSPVDLTGSCATSTKAESERRTGGAIPTAAAAASSSSSVSGESGTVKESAVKGGNGTPMVWPAWVYCTRYSDRPSSG